MDYIQIDSTIQKLRPSNIEKQNSNECIRCGQCCLHIPCYWAQLYHGLTKKGDRCPDLELLPNGKYNCKYMNHSELMRREMLNTGCHYPKWRKKI